MADLTKVTGVANADIDKIDGVAAADISKVAGVAKPSAAPAATRWIIGADSGKLYHTTTSNASAGWEELVDIGTETFRGVAIGQDGSGEKQWVVYAATNAAEINYASASADLTNAANWTTVNFGTNYIGINGGPGVAWGNNVWMSTGKRIHDGDSYRTIMRSTDGAVTWASVDHGSTVNDNAVAICYKGTGQIWSLAHQSHVWVSTNDGVGWTDTATLEGTTDINAICYDGSDKWLAALSNSNVYYSTNDWGANTEGTLTGAGTVYGAVYMKGSVNKFIIVTTAGEIHHSPDGATWTEASSYNSDNAIRAIATDHTTVVAVGSAGSIQTSTDGDTWTVRAVDGNPDRQFSCVSCDVIGAGTNNG
tara:strand:- start:3084 stop:4175 length:1092 start_codon:yes stop_codon:yes gene_type:complete